MKGEDKPVRSENFETVIRALRGGLTWTVEERPGTGFAVSSDPAAKRHLIDWPQDAFSRAADLGFFTQDHYFGYIHELCHALLAENVHPLFSSPRFLSGTEPELIDRAMPALGAALDWFAEWEVFRRCPARKGRQVALRLGLAREMALLGAAAAEPAPHEALLLAQGLLYLGVEPFPGARAEGLARIMARVPPGRPRLPVLAALADRLLRQDAGLCILPHGGVWVLDEAG